ncbi:MAG: hypothetical protein E5V54_11295 [Mesorhizobium sp.]|nr:MAG: hypothetical protein E5V54_11295 [Mesorhizobium sp.]
MKIPSDIRRIANRIGGDGIERREIALAILAERERHEKPAQPDRFRAQGTRVMRLPAPGKEPGSYRLGFPVLELNDGIVDAEGVTAKVAALLNRHWVDEE